MSYDAMLSTIIQPKELSIFVTGITGNAVRHNIISVQRRRLESRPRTQETEVDDNAQ